MADGITKLPGTMGLVYFHIALCLSWMVFVDGSPWPTPTHVISLEELFLDRDRRHPDEGDAPDFSQIVESSV